MLFLLGETANAFALRNYQGQPDSTAMLILKYFLIIVPSLALLYFLSMAIYRKLRWVIFCRRCRAKGLNSLEESLLNDFAQRLNIDNESAILEDRAALNLFLNRVSHFYEGVSMNEAAYQGEIALFDKIWQKLVKLMPPMSTDKLSSTRNLPLDMPLLIHLEDPESKQVFFFSSKVLACNAFSLIVAPPSLDLQKQTSLQKKPFCDVSFFTDDATEFSFQSQLFRALEEKEGAWCLRHAQSLVKEEVAVPIRLEATALFSKDEGKHFLDLEAHLLLINQRWCTFEVQTFETLAAGSPVILSFSLNESFITLRGVLSQVKAEEGKATCRLFLRKLGHEEQEKIIQYMRAKKK